MLRHGEFAELLAAAKAGDDWAWERIFKDLVGPLTGYFASRGAPDPEDLASETFLHVARSIHSFRGDEASFRSWVFVIAHRRMIDRRRSDSRTVGGVALDRGKHPEGGDVEEEAMASLGTADLVRGLQILTDEQREVLALRVIADLTLEETAVVVDRSVGAVKGLQRRALDNLRRQLDLEAVSNEPVSAITEMK